MIRRWLQKVFSTLTDIKKLKIFIIEAFTDNMTLKFISVIITLTLFVLIAGESVQVSKAVKIEYVTAEDMMIVNTVPYEFEMILSGPKSLIGAIRARDYVYTINLVSTGIGTTGVRIDPRQLGLDRGILVSSLMPPVVYPRLEKMVYKTVGVMLITEGKVKNGLVKSLTIEPKEIKISGPDSFLSEITHIFTEPFPLSKVTVAGKYPLKLKLPHEKISLVEPAADLIRLSIEFQ